MNIAVILAAGSGTRLGTAVPKQFLPLDGQPVIAHSLDAFQCCESIGEICVVTHPDHIAYVERLAASGRWPKVKCVIAGGKERSDSSLAAIRHYAGHPSADSLRLLFHDAARPLASVALIGRVCQALDAHRAVSAAIPSTDTVFEVEGTAVRSVPDRTRLRRVQTPQGFHLSVIAEAYRRALADSAFHATDDCGVVLRYMPEEEVHTVEGEADNIKVTLPSDLPIAERLLRQRAPQAEADRDGADPDRYMESHRRQELRPLQLKMLEMLTVVGDILDRHGIRWWMQGGTLLGAVRHGGFIPWDDDMDIDVYKEDVPRMVEVLRSELPPTLILPEPPAHTPIYKVRSVDSFFVEYADDFAAPYNKGVYIDIYPQGDVPALSRSFVRRVARQYCRANSILHRQHYYSARSFAEYFWFGGLRLLCRAAWSAALLVRPNRGEWLAQDLVNNGSGLIHRKDKIFPLQRIPFEDRTFPAPADPDFYLREDFGDYTQLPPPEQRHGHAVYYNVRLEG